MFQMESHDGQCFTMWYGVYDASRRTLRYASAGHHPGYLRVPGATDVTPLKTSGLMVGAARDTRYRVAETTVPGGSRLYLFTDGIFEIVTNKGRWGLRDFVPLLRQPMQADTPECQRLYKRVKAVCHPRPFDDDVSLMVVTFP
jgi:sigma-B regulation protein RsbU (phosphoserine phosphatase)